MNITKLLGSSLLLSVLLGPVSDLQATDAVHPIMITLKATAASEETLKGDVLTVRPLAFRADTGDIIEAMGQLQEITFSSKAQLLLIRRDIENAEGDSVLVVREAGREDLDVTEFIGFEPNEQDVETGTLNIVTGKAKTTSLAIGTVSLQIPGAASLLAQGLSTEKRASINVNGEELPANLSSLSAKLVGQGTIVDGETETFVIVDITLTVGAPKLVEVLR